MLHRTPLRLGTDNWTINSLAAKSQDIGRILAKKGASNIFKYFAVDQPLSSVDLLSEEKDYVEVIYTAKTFFGLLQSSFDGFYYYASGDIELLNIGGVGSRDNLRQMTFPSHFKEYSEHGKVNFWLGKPNVTAYTHYDTSYNFHFVATGRKKFILFPPSAYSRLQLYPCLHQLYRQVDTDVLAGENYREFVREMKGYEVEIVDGDVLYIPPFWFHSVVTVDTTLSINIWSQSEAFLTMDTIYKAAIPFEAEWGRVKLMKAMCYFIQSLVQQVLAGFDMELDSDNFIIDHVYSRYEIVMGKKSGEIEPKLSKLTQEVQEYCLNEPIADMLSEEAVNHLQNGGNRIAEQFSDIHPPAVREINLANYIEHLVWRILGKEDTLQLPVYLYQCFHKANFVLFF